jgi:hypothetical protein
MAKQFIKVDKWNLPKNKVQEVCQNELKKLNQTLWINFEDATHAITDKFDSALDKYQGKAKIPQLKQFRPNPDCYQYYIEDVIYLTIYEIKGGNDDTTI